MKPEMRWLQSLSIRGESINRGMVRRVQLQESVDAIGQYLLLELDDPRSDVVPALQGENPQLEAIFGVDSVRGGAVKESDKIPMTFQVLRCKRMPTDNETYRILGIVREAKDLLERRKFLLNGVTPQEILRKIVPIAVREESAILLPTTDFHCLHERPIVPLSRYLQEHGLLAMLKASTTGIHWSLVDLGKVFSLKSKRTFTSPDVGAPYPCLRLQTLASDYMASLVHDRMPFHVDLLDGPDEMQAPPLFRQVSNPMTRLKSTFSLRPKYDFQTHPSWGVRTGEMVEVEPYLNQNPVKALTMRMCWQEVGSYASQRILVGDIVNYKGAQ